MFLNVRKTIIQAAEEKRMRAATEIFSMIILLFSAFRLRITSDIRIAEKKTVIRAKMIRIKFLSRKVMYSL